MINKNFCVKDIYIYDSFFMILKKCDFKKALKKCHKNGVYVTYFTADANQINVFTRHVQKALPAFGATNFLLNLSRIPGLFSLNKIYYVMV